MIAVLLLTTFAAAAQLSLPDVIEEARRANPELAAMRSRLEAARRRVNPAAAPESPRVDLERMYAPRGPLTTAEEKSVAVTQELPFPTTLALRRRAARQDARSAEAELRAKELEVEARARGAFARLYLAHRATSLFEENTDLMRRFARVAESRYAAGRVSQTDSLKAQVELARMLGMQLETKRELEMNSAELNALLGRPAGSPLDEPEEPPRRVLPPSASELYAKAEAGNPTLARARSAAARAGTEVSLARSEFLPDIMVQLRRRSMMEGRTTQDAVLGLSVPLWFWGPGGRTRAASAERDAAGAELRAAGIETAAGVRSLYAAWEAAHKREELYRTSVLPIAEQDLRVAESGYQTGKVSFLELMDAARSLLGSRLEYYGYVAEAEQRAAEMSAVLGEAL